MANVQKPLDINQQKLINIVKTAHKNLAVARKMKVSETERRISEFKIKMTRALEESEAVIRHDLEAELQAHASALDEALIAAYDGGVAVRRIALDGFGNRYDGAVHVMLTDLRKDGRVGSRGHDATSDPSAISESYFPKPIDIDSILSEATTVEPPKFDLLVEPLELIPADKDGNDGMFTTAVRLTLDSRDLWFRSIAGRARPGTRYMDATYCTLYVHPFSDNLIVAESEETGVELWDHPIARWAKEYPEAARKGFDAAISPNA
jgi:hypothetical protein